MLNDFNKRKRPFPGMKHCSQKRKLTQLAILHSKTATSFLQKRSTENHTNEAAVSANLRASKAAAQVSRLQRFYTIIRAPFSGIVGARLVFPGSSIKINDTLLAVVNRVQPLLLSFSVPEKHLPLLRTAMNSNKKHDARLKVVVSLPSNKSLYYSGEVLFMDNAVDSATGTILMRAALRNEDETLTPG